MEPALVTSSKKPSAGHGPWKLMMEVSKARDFRWPGLRRKSLCFKAKISRLKTHGPCHLYKEGESALLGICLEAF